MSEKTKTKYDMHSPEAKALTDEIVHGTFTKEGTMAAFPTCFPGASIPIPADESHITALDVSGDGMIYGGTSGRATHLFVGIFHGVTGVVFDRGTVEGATHCAAVCCGKSRFLACVNGPGGGRVVSGGFEGLPYDLIQEWGFGRSALQELGKVNDEPIVHAVTDASKKVLVGTTSGHLFTVDIEGGSIKVVGEVSGSGRLALGSKGGVFGQDGSAHLWRYDVGSGKIERQAIAFPEGAWGKVPLTWAKDHHSGLLYTADAVGNLFSLEEERGFSGPLARTLLAPVGPMAVTHDGRVFGFCGPEMAKMFCYNPRTREATNLGVAVSVLERRRYGYVFGDAVTGRDGQIIFGEDDDLGHLWLYFPRIQALS
jgi:outer membrane protein assembly factor BamB